MSFRSSSLRIGDILRAWTAPQFRGKELWLLVFNICQAGHGPHQHKCVTEKSFPPRFMALCNYLPFSPTETYLWQFFSLSIRTHSLSFAIDCFAEKTDRLHFQVDSYLHPYPSIFCLFHRKASLLTTWFTNRKSQKEEVKERNKRRS